MPPAASWNTDDADGPTTSKDLLHHGQHQPEPIDFNKHRHNKHPYQRYATGAGRTTEISLPYGGHGFMMNNGNTTAMNDSNNIGGANQDGRHQTRGVQPTPLFERLVTEEVQELKAYARIIESQNRRLAELEKVHGDLEVRLEQESRSRQQLEATLEEKEREWSEKYATLEKDRDHWKEVVQIEQTKNSRLIEQVVRKDQDIQKMLQRKYDQPREGHFNQTNRNFRPPVSSATINDPQRSGTPNSATRSPSMDQHKSPHEILSANGSAEAVRARNATQNLIDFFALK